MKELKIDMQKQMRDIEGDFGGRFPAMMAVISRKQYLHDIGKIDLSYNDFLTVVEEVIVKYVESR